MLPNPPNRVHKLSYFADMMEIWWHIRPGFIMFRSQKDVDKHVQEIFRKITNEKEVSPCSLNVNISSGWGSSWAGHYFTSQNYLWIGADTPSSLHWVLFLRNQILLFRLCANTLTGTVTVAHFWWVRNGFHVSYVVEDVAGCWVLTSETIMHRRSLTFPKPLYFFQFSANVVHA